MSIPPGSRGIEAVAAIIVQQEHILLIQRGNPPQQGCWTLPGGKVEEGESHATALRREVAEETGYQVQVGALACQLSVPLTAISHYLISDYHAQIISGQLSAGDDAADARWIPLKELDQYPLTDKLLDYLHRAGLPVPR